MRKLTLLVLFLTAGIIANAQPSSAANQTVTLTLQNKIEIAVEGSPTGNSFTFDEAGDYATGLTNLNASMFRVKSNQNYAVTVASQDANFTSTAATTMPASVLGVRITGGTTFTSLSTTATQIATGSRGNNTFEVDYNANPGFNYDAGSYTLVVVYTATQQ